MTIIVATREFIAADSRLSIEGGETATIGKIFKRRGGGLFATAGDSRRTHHFEKAMKKGREPDELDLLENEDFDAILLLPDRSLVRFDTNFAPFPVGESWVAVGAPSQVVRSWIINRADPVTALRRAIEVDSGCGYPITIAYLSGRIELMDHDGKITVVASGKRKR